MSTFLNMHFRIVFNMITLGHIVTGETFASSALLWQDQEQLQTLCLGMLGILPHCFEDKHCPKGRRQVPWLCLSVSTLAGRTGQLHHVQLCNSPPPLPSCVMKPNLWGRVLPRFSLLQLYTTPNQGLFRLQSSLLDLKNNMPHKNWIKINIVKWSTQKLENLLVGKVYFKKKNNSIYAINETQVLLSIWEENTFPAKNKANKNCSAQIVKESKFISNWKYVGA